MFRTSNPLFLTLILGAFITTVASDIAPRPIVPAEFEGAKQPQVAVHANGDIYVAFGKDNELFVTRSTDGGRGFKKPVSLGELPKLSLGMRRGPRLVVSDKAITVAAISHGDGNLYSWRSADQGATWLKSPAINSVPGCAREGLHALAGNSGGELYAVWLDMRQGKMQLWGSRSADAGKSWQANVSIYVSPDKNICECCHPSVIMDETDTITAMWRNWLGGSRDMYRAVSMDQGKTFSEAAKLGEGTWKLQGCPMDGGLLARQGKRLSTVWRRNTQIFATMDGSPERLLGTGTHPIVVSGGEKFHYFWQSGSTLYHQREDENSARTFSQKGTYVSAAALPKDKGIVVVWESTEAAAPLMLQVVRVRGEGL